MEGFLAALRCARNDSQFTSGCLGEFAKRYGRRARNDNEEKASGLPRLFMRQKRRDGHALLPFDDADQACRLGGGPELQDACRRTYFEREGERELVCAPPSLCRVPSSTDSSSLNAGASTSSQLLPSFHGPRAFGSPR